MCIIQLNQIFDFGDAPDQDHLNNLKNEIAAIDSELDGKKFLFGDDLTIADFFVFSVFLTLDEMTDIEIGGANIPMFMNRIKGQLFSHF